MITVQTKNPDQTKKTSPNIDYKATITWRRDEQEAKAQKQEHEQEEDYKQKQ